MSSKQISFDALLCDFDGTLVDTAKAIAYAWEKWAASIDLPLPALTHRPRGRAVAEVIHHLAPSLDPAAELAKFGTYELSDLTRILPTPGARAFLQTINGSIPWAIVTASPRPVVLTILQSLGLPLPSVLVTYEDAPQNKPAPQCYQLAANRLGLDPARCLVIEDTPAGVSAGFAAGMPVLALGTTNLTPDLASAIGAHFATNLSALDPEVIAQGRLVL